jgi:hypothetical protein
VPVWGIPVVGFEAPPGDDSPIELGPPLADEAGPVAVPIPP